MRPQQNRRMRGRGSNTNNNNNNNNRKGPNPLTRSYESNGPDVKIRGSAQQIAEKYTTLARDAQTSGDRVMAENYLQHAEHYNRLIMAAQAQMPQQQVRDAREDDQDEDGEEGFNPSGNEQPNQPQPNQPQPNQQQRNNGSGPQPVIDGTPAEVVLRQAPVEQGGALAETSGGDAPADPGRTEEAAPRKPRRPRRSTRAKSGDDEQPASDEEPVTEAAQ